ncbi:hypothetical protein [Streptomyces poriticola]|uniref:hypothetical protein n=1 Tax=Streptomyces poriticola TaxID=3120506 RepID=UPI002FCE012D
MLPLAGLDGWSELSPWHYYAGSDPLANGISPPHLLVLAAITALAVMAGLRRFEHRDLKG